MSAMQSRVACLLLVLSLWHSPSWAQCAPAPDSPYFFRNLAEQRAEAKLAENRSFYDELLSEGFLGKNSRGKQLPKQDFIESELAANRSEPHKGFYAVRDFSLVEHRKGFAMTTYRLVEGSTANGAARAIESWQREIYEVEGGKWRLMSIEGIQPPAAQAAKSAASNAH
jgi:hypothetical protein